MDSEIDVERLRQGAAYAGQWLAYQQGRRDLPGLVAVIRLDNETVLARSYGFANLERSEPMAVDHIFRIASHSKTFTATAVMLLVQEGQIRLDDTLGRYLDGLPPEIGAVTLRQALNHTGGIVRDGHNADYWQLYRPFPGRDELHALTTSVLPPNDSFKYSNIGFSLVGEVVATVSGMTYNDFVRRHILAPLGLVDTGPEMDEHGRKRLVQGYTGGQLPFPRTPIPDVETGAMSAATGFYSTAPDLARYASAHFLGNEELLTDASKRELQGGTWPVAQTEGQYGLGFAAQTFGERRMVGHGGSFPGHSTRTWIDPRDRLAVVILTNETGGPAALLAEGVIRILDFALAATPLRGQPHVDLDRFTGRFVNTWGVSDIVRFGHRLYSLDPNTDNPVKYPTELEVLDGDTLRIGRTGGYGSPGETVRFERDAEGKVVRVVSGGASMEPIDRFRLVFPEAD